MGFGVLLKTIAPLSLYLLGILGCVLSITGRHRLALVLITFFMPLRNVVDKIQEFPLGNQMVDALLISTILGIIFSKANSQGRFKKTFLNAPAIAMMLYLTISLLWGNIHLYGAPIFDLSSDRTQDWKNICLFPIIFFTFIHAIKDRKQANLIFWVSAFAIFISAYYTVNQTITHNSLESRERISGTFQFLGPNEVAAFFNANTLILLAVMYKTKEWYKKLLLLLLILLSVYCIVFLYSRGAYAGFLLGLAFFFAFKDKKFLIPIVLLILFWQQILPIKVVERIKQTKTDLGELDESSKRRVDIWETAIELFKNSPILGIGFGVFRYLGLDLKDTHNIYVKFLVEQGVIGLLIFIWLIIAFLCLGWQCFKKARDGLDQNFGLGLCASVVVILVNNFFGDRWSYLEVSSFLWIYAALAVIYLLEPINESLREDHAKKQIKEIKLQPKPRKQRYYDPRGNDESS